MAWQRQAPNHPTKNRKSNAVTSEANRSFEKRKKCPACSREFTGTLIVCKHDGTLLIPVKPDPLIGALLADKYKIDSEIGRGGMSIVYKGRHELMDRPVAIKMLQAQLVEDQTSIKRFQQEAKAASCLTHPNVITVYDFGVSPTGQPYLVMDYLQGESLIDVIKRDNHIAVNRTLNIFIQACDALQHAHQKGVIHRDLKSSNVMLTEFEGKHDVVKVVDFGIAKLMPSSGKQSQNLTQTGEIFGSPIYMSPEQCLGQVLDARSDIYSMGAMLYEALTGEPPLMGDTVVNTMQMHVSTNPPQFDEIRPDLHIPIQLQRVCMKALEKRPECRYNSMDEFKEALEHIERQLDTMPAPPPTSQAAQQRIASPRQTRQNLTGQREPMENVPKPVLDDGREASKPNPPASKAAVTVQKPSQPVASAPFQPRPVTPQGFSASRASAQKQSEEEGGVDKKLIIIGVAIIIFALILGVWFILIPHPSASPQ